MDRSIALGQNQTPALAGIEGIEITGLTADSRAVRPGFLFAALPGAKADGLSFVAEAARRGAVAVLAPARPDLPARIEGLPVIADLAARRRFALMAAAFYGAQPETVVAVTGTSGKSSTVSFTRQIWKSLGKSAASLGTLGIESDSVVRYSGLTTADPVQLHADLAELAHAGVTHAAIEASSHGLDQHRLDGVKVKAAGFTGFGRDHLDYHPTTDDYFQAKARLFTEVLQPGGTAVLNADIPEFARLETLARGAGHSVIAYGAAGRDLEIRDRAPVSGGQTATLDILGRTRTVTLPLAGGFQLMNALCALGLAIACGEDPVGATDALEHLTGVRGRMELAATLANGAAVYVDYAHKPDALETVLKALRPHTKGKLVVVFGCGGDRDRGKRPIMGEIAARLADRVVVTDDNSRTEDPAAIRAQILASAPGAVEIGDRATAIAEAVAGLSAGDVLVIAGKGHEQGQIVGTNTIPFDDAEAVRAAVAELKP